MATATDPGWRPALIGLIPGIVVPMLVLRSRGPLIQVRGIWLSAMTSLLFFWHVVPDLVADPVAAPVGVVGPILVVEAIALVATSRYRSPPLAAPPETLGARYRDRSVLNIAFLCIGPLSAFNAVFAVGSATIFAVSLPLPFLGLTVIAPSRRSIERLQADRIARGNEADVLAALT